MATSADTVIAELPLSQGQRALWFLQHLDPLSAAHNVTHAARVFVDFDIPLLRQAFQHVVDRHPVLRTLFVLTNGEPRQCTYAHKDVAFTYVDASPWPPALLQERMTNETYRPFDLEREPAFRVSVYKRSAGEYIVLLALHHIITDMWSLALIMHEASLLYGAAVTGQTVRLTDPGADFSSFVNDEIAFLAGPEGERQWAFWKEYLAGELPRTEILTDRTRPPLPSHRGSTESFRFPSSLAAQLRALSKSQGAMLHMTVLAAYAALLHRYTGQDEVVIGAPKALRDRKTAWVMGYYVNPLPIRIDLSGDPSFLELVVRVKKSVTEAYAHDRFPFPLLVDRLQPARDLSRYPLFQVMFSWQKTFGVVDSRRMTSFALGEDGRGMTLNELSLESFALDEFPVPFDLTLMAAEANDSELVMTFEYSLDLFDRTTIARMLVHLRTLMEDIIENPQRPLSQISLLSGADRRQVLEEWNPDPASQDVVEPIQEYIDRQGRERPEAIAIVTSSSTLTYGDLVDRANSLAHHLVSQGVVAETCVVVMMERSVDALVALLAVLKSGGVYVPVAPNLPQDRVAFILADSGARCVLTQSGLLNRLPTHLPTVVVYDVNRDDLGGIASSPPNVRILEGQAAYVIYTSGSTGVPKGVIVTHQSLSLHCQTMRDRYRLTEKDRVLQFAPLDVDASLEQILVPLMAGATVVLRGEELWSPQEFVRITREAHLTVVDLPPGYWHQAAQVPSSLFDSGVASLRLIIVGGEVVRTKSVQLWRSTPWGTVRIINAYGPTEATITSVAWDVPHDVSGQLALEYVPIGRPLVHRRGYVLDRFLQPVIPGAPGELVLGGAGLARGYLGRPELTAERFVPDPYSGVSGSRMYRTGDLVRHRSEGILEFLTRVDHQVKVRGFRVELPEIEAALLRCPGVAEAAAALVQEDDGDQRIVGYVVPMGSGSLSDEIIRPFLARVLPVHMIPGTIVVLSALPHTHTGKIDRRALPRPLARKAGGPDSPPGERTPTEATIAVIWEQVLGTSGIGNHDNFFELGGHSLLAMQVASRIAEAYSVDVPLRDVFEWPTVAGLARRIEEHIFATTDEQTLASALAECEGLDEQHVRTLLEQEGSARQHLETRRDQE